jgi:predicted NBD/HSP70 family sugar kinase/biotin operon repressor
MMMVTRQPLTGSNSSNLKSHNLRAILLALLQHDYISRVHLAKLTGLSTTTITNLVTELLEQGIVVEEGPELLERQKGAGRPRQALRLVPEARYAIGVHIGVGSVRLALTDLRATIVEALSFNHSPDSPALAVLGQIVELVNQVVAQSKVDPQQVIGVGVGTSGLTNPVTGINVLAPNLNWRDVPVQSWLRSRLSFPVCVDNNVRTMALGEALFGAARQVRVSAFVYGRVGVGAGFVVDGQPYHGSGAGAGEIGHLTVLPEGGELCRCGNRGCLETLVSEPAILRLARPLMQPTATASEISLDSVFAAARAGDQAIRTMLEERAHYMGLVLANLVNIISPELILLGGIFAQGHDLLLPTIEATVRERAFANLGASVRIQPTSFGSKAGVIGGAALALTTFFYHQDQLTMKQASLSQVTL